MRLVRYGPAGHEKPGLLDRQDRIRDLSHHIKDIDPEPLTPSGLAALSSIDETSLPIVAGVPRLGAPITRVGKVLSVAMNYRDLAAALGAPEPSEPRLISKAVNSLQGPNDDVILPEGSKMTDWEVELGIVIGRTARSVDGRQALDCVAGYVCVNDLSERACQIERGGAFDNGKSFDTFGPIGPWLATPDELPDVGNLDLWLDVNGRRMQAGNTREMIFGVAALVTFASRFMTMAPGDLIATGTPAGMGASQRPHPIFLKPGDVLDLGVAGLGVQRQVIQS